MQSNEETVRYIDRTRDYYRALGYSKDYVWAAYDEVPFARLGKPLREARIGLVTTAHPLDGSNVDAKGVRQVWSAPIDPPPATLSTGNLAWDKESTHTEDRESFLPIVAASSLVRDGIIAGLTARFHGAPTKYSQRETIEVDAPLILERLKEDGADAVLLSAL